MNGSEEAVHRLAVKVARPGYSAVVLAQGIVQFDSGPLSGCEFCGAEEAQHSSLRALTARHDHSLAQTQISNRLNTHHRIFFFSRRDRCGAFFSMKVNISALGIIVGVLRLQSG